MSGSTAAISGPSARDDSATEPGSATVAFFVGTTLPRIGSFPNCSATLITPNTVLSAAHCLDRFENGGSVGIAAQTSTGEIAVVDGPFPRCAVHPDAVDEPVSSCEAYPEDISVFSQNEDADLVVFELERSIDGVLHRPVGPPRSCLGTSVQPMIARGFAPGRTPSERGRILMDGERAEGHLRLLAALEGDALDPGDSGGTINEEVRDVRGPVVGVTSKHFAFANEWAASLLWRKSDELTSAPIGWLWDQLDLVEPSRHARSEGSDELADTDMDGIPDECDPCPDVPPSDDPELSGTCEGHCDFDEDDEGVECDNCPGSPDGGLETANPLQANCNEDAELQDPDAPERGDLCDPTPCAETRLRTTTTEIDRFRVRRRLDRAAIEPLATVVDEARAGTRWCPCRGATKDDESVRIGGDVDTPCIEDQGDGTGLCAISELGAYDGPTAEQLFWRPISVSYGFPVEEDDIVGSDPLRLEVVWPYEPPADDEEFRAEYAGQWDFVADGLRWQALFGEDPPDDGPQGVFWTHTPGGPDAGDFFDPTGQRLLTSHYWSGLAEARIDVAAPPPDPCFLPIIPWIASPPVCPVCSGAFPGPWMGLPRTLPFAGAGPPLCGAPRLLPPQLWLGQQAIAADDLFVGGSGAALTDNAGARWITASEPRAWLPEQGIAYMALAHDEPEPVTALRISDQGLAVPGVQEPPPPIDQPQLLSTAEGSAPRPPARQDGLTVLSASRRVLWIGGGTGEDGQLLRDLWALDLDDGGWRQLAPPAAPRPARVLAATYSPVADALWVLDVVSGPPPGALRRSDRAHPRGPRAAPARERVRLLRLDPLGRSSEVVASWPRRAHLQRYALATDASGALYVAASREVVGPHVLLELVPEPGDGVRIAGFQIGRGALAAETIRADEPGIALPVQRFRRAPELVGYRYDELRPAPPSPIRRCF